MCCRRLPTGQAPKRARFCCLSQPLELDRPTGTSCGHWALLRALWLMPSPVGDPQAALTLLSTLTPQEVMVTLLQPVQSPGGDSPEAWSCSAGSPRAEGSSSLRTWAGFSRSSALSLSVSTVLNLFQPQAACVWEFPGLMPLQKSYSMRW